MRWSQFGTSCARQRQLFKSNLNKKENRMKDSLRHFRTRLSTILACLAVSIAGAVISPVSTFADTLYGITFNTQFISIDPATGAGTLIGPTTTQMGPFGLGSR